MLTVLTMGSEPAPIQTPQMQCLPEPALQSQQQVFTPLAPVDVETEFKVGFVPSLVASCCLRQLSMVLTLVSAAFCCSVSTVAPAGTAGFTTVLVLVFAPPVLLVVLLFVLVEPEVLVFVVVVVPLGTVVLVVTVVLLVVMVVAGTVVVVVVDDVLLVLLATAGFVFTSITTGDVLFVVLPPGTTITPVLLLVEFVAVAFYLQFTSVRFTVGDPAPALIPLIKKNRPVNRPANARSPSKARQHGVPLFLSLQPSPWYKCILRSLSGSDAYFTTFQQTTGASTGAWLTGGLETGSSTYTYFFSTTGPAFTVPTFTGLTIDQEALQTVLLRGGSGGPAAVYTSIGSRLMLDLIRDEVIAAGGLGANSPLIAVPLQISDGGCVPTIGPTSCLLMT